MNPTIVTMLFLNNNQWFGIRVMILCLSVPANEVHIVVNADYFSSSVGLNVSLCYLARFVIKESMRVTAPGHTSHIDPKFSY
jgi:hypothetical protein